jgi:hypothetical protein
LAKRCILTVLWALTSVFSLDPKENFIPAKGFLEAKRYKAR